MVGKLEGRQLSMGLLPCQGGTKLEWRPCWVVEGAEGQAGVKFQKPRDKQCEASGKLGWG